MKIAIGPEMWSEPRFEALRLAMGWDTPRTVGALVMFWHATRDARVQSGSLAELARYLPIAEREAVLLQMVAQGYLTADGLGGFAIDGNQRAIDLLEKRRQCGKLGNAAFRQKADAKQHRDKPPARGRALSRRELDPEKEARAAVWENYRRAFTERYGTEPTRNGKVNRNILDFVKRVGITDAPPLIEFFVRHDDYSRWFHQVGHALRDAEALHAQWRLGRQITAQDHQQQLRLNGVASQLERIRGGHL